MEIQKKQKGIVLKLIVSILIILSFIIIPKNIVNSASFSSNIDGIDEAKYPGFKQKIKQLQTIYPNIQVLYTGLDWNTVIKNEHSEVHGRNLVETSLGNEWICQECKTNAKLYDSGLYCASEDAIRYVMDPRNYLNTTDIFQFQKLNTAVGTNESEIKKILQAQNVTYLQNDEDAIKAFAKVAKDNNINAYHLITRVIQEQGKDGSSILASGNGYTGNGYIDYGKGYYNLFSINASRSNNEPTYMIYINALDKAMNEEPAWDSRANSILGGGKYVSNSYIDVGQNTLYLQKFDVYNKNGSLYWHQYMQNLFGAQNEAKILKSLYQVNGKQNSKDFVFIIPLYENMPKAVSSKPKDKYTGDINTDLKTMNIAKNSSGNEYIYGNILIAEWINNVANTPNGLPKMTLKSTDGKYSADMYVKHEGGLNYYYDRVISNLDTSKEYYIEVKLSNESNVGTKKVQRANLNVTNKKIGTFDNKILTISNNKIVFQKNGYIGEINTDLQTMTISKNTANREYIYGEILIAEWINGVAKVPNGLPEMTLKSTDGKYSAGMYVKQIDGLKYYYDRVIYNLDTNKEYYIEVKLTNKNNVSDKKIQNANINVKNKTVGKFKDKNMNITNNKITFKGNEYKGEINTDLKTMKLAKNEVGREYISGEILIAEWINGVANVPNGLPEMTLKSTDGKYSAGMYIKQLDGLKYYYDRVVFNLDTSKEYYIEVKLTNKNNTSNKKVQKANINVTNKKIGTLKGETFTIKNNTIIFEKATRAVTLNVDEEKEKQKINIPVDLKTNEKTKVDNSKQIEKEEDKAKENKNEANQLEVNQSEENNKETNQLEANQSKERQEGKSLKENTIQKKSSSNDSTNEEDNSLKENKTQEKSSSKKDNTNI